MDTDLVSDVWLLSPSLNAEFSYLPLSMTFL